MARPKTKQELLDASQQNYEKLITYVDSYTEEEKAAEFPQGTMNRNMRDVLAHLHHWHTMMMEWYEVGMTGAKPDMPAKGYTWKTVPALNKEIWEEYQAVELETVRTILEKSFSALQQIIQKHSDDELFEKKRYPWTGSTSLGSYLVSATSSHYDWALKFIKKAKK